MSGRSYCESCKKKLGVLDLIPLFSFFFLRGKCRYCHVHLSLYYPLVELTTGILIAATFLFIMISVNTSIISTFQYIKIILFYFFVVSCLVAIFFTDIKYGIIPDKIVYPLTFFTLL